MHGSLCDTHKLYCGIALFPLSTILADTLKHWLLLIGSSAEHSPPGTPTTKRNNASHDLAGSNAVVNLGGLGLKKKKKGSPEMRFTDPAGNPLPKEILNSVTLFQRKQKKGVIDVWWLYDDGGRQPSS